MTQKFTVARNMSANAPSNVTPGHGSGGLRYNGRGVLFIPINMLAFRSLRRDQINDASALVNLARNFGGSIGIAFASTLVTRREQFHQSRLVE
jgi:hypothetical protein